MIDLAGSERVKKSGVEGMQFTEATNINQTLLSLGMVFKALREKVMYFTIIRLLNNTYHI